VGTGTVDTEIVNNLVHGDIRMEGGMAQLRNNLARRLQGYFVDPVKGDLAITATASAAIDAGESRPEVVDDIRNRRRPNRPDIGAWEFDLGRDR
jgi:hypothetical protein